MNQNQNQNQKIIWIWILIWKWKIEIENRNGKEKLNLSLSWSLTLLYRRSSFGPVNDLIKLKSCRKLHLANLKVTPHYCEDKNLPQTRRCFRMGLERPTFDIWTWETVPRGKEIIDKLVTLHLPSPDDQLILETDAAKGSGDLPAGIRHVLFAMVNGTHAHG